MNRGSGPDFDPTKIVVYVCWMTFLSLGLIVFTDIRNAAEDIDDKLFPEVGIWGCTSFLVAFGIYGLVYVYQLMRSRRGRSS